MFMLQQKKQGLILNLLNLWLRLKSITGKKHLDDMTPDELDKMIAYTTEKQKRQKLNQLLNQLQLKLSLPLKLRLNH